MKKEGIPSSGYEFDFAGGENNGYTFTTENNLQYVVTFVPTFYLFEDNFALSKEIFELVIAVSDKNKLVAFDNLTGLTISAIINDFYQRSPLITTLFICDDSDRRELARHRKFRLWFSSYNEPQNQFRKFDFEWKDTTTRIIYISVILLSDNPYAEQIKQRFSLLTDDIQQEK